MNDSPFPHQSAAPRRRGHNESNGQGRPTVSRSPSKYGKKSSSTTKSSGGVGALLSPLNLGILLTAFGLYSHFMYSYNKVDQEQVRWAKTSRDHIIKTSNVHAEKTAKKVHPSAPKIDSAPKQQQQHHHQPGTASAAHVASRSLKKEDAVDDKTLEAEDTTTKSIATEKETDASPKTKDATTVIETAPYSAAAAGDNSLSGQQFNRLHLADIDTSFLFKQTPEQAASRHLRFPSVQDRVKVYMSNWYTPPCPGNNQALVPYQYIGDDSDPDPDTTASDLLFQELPHTHPEPAGNDFGKVRGYRVGHHFEFARIIHLHLDDLKSFNCTTNDYCVDVLEYYLPALERLDGVNGDNNNNNNKESKDELPIPLLTQWGDSDFPKAYTPTHAVGELPQVPYIMKFRFRFLDDSAIADMTTSTTNINGQDCIPGERHMYKTVAVPTGAHGMSYFQPIVWRLTSLRHYGVIPKIPESDIPWLQKKNAAIWRGALTGIYRNGFTLKLLKTKTPREICELMHRCKLVLSYATSSLVDALLLASTKQEKMVPHEVDGHVLFAAQKATYADMLQYKAIIMLEGNDISSGLKWALYSNSVVMTQAPTKTSWAMEELLEPWVHYVPLNDDLTDVEEKMQWIIDHDQEAQEISHRGSLWVQDLLYHPDVQHEDAQIYDEMLRRYRAHFVHDPNLIHTMKSEHDGEEGTKVKSKSRSKNE